MNAVLGAPGGYTLRGERVDGAGQRVGLSCVCCVSVCFFFFFSSRRRHTRLSCDWSSDVCSSDPRLNSSHTIISYDWSSDVRSEERRVGKEGKSPGAPEPLKKKKKSRQRT